MAETPPSGQPDDATKRRGINRRELMTAGAGAAGVATVAAFWFEGFGDARRRRKVTPAGPGESAGGLTPAQRATLGCAQDRLLPSEGPDSPGARDANTIGYLDALMASNYIKEESKEIVRRGAARLDRAARWLPGGHSDFSTLAPELQDAIIQRLETSSDGLILLRKLLSYTLEAFFGDPVHGSNVGEIAWRWAEHRPGYPRPSRPNFMPKETP